jgi:hypothetical protein
MTAPGVNLRIPVQYVIRLYANNHTDVRLRVIASTSANVQSVSSELDGLVYDFSPMPFENLHGLIIPEACKSVRCNRGISHRMLNVLTSQIVLWLGYHARKTPGNSRTHAAVGGDGA